jgi:GNAT superfamily N-acetyltransferase
MIIRQAGSPDAAAVAALYVRARRAGLAAGTIPPLTHSEGEVRRWVTHIVIPTLECWLAERAPAVVVGMLVLEAGWIDQLYVDPDLTRAGIGGELIAVAKRQRPNGLRLWTFVSNRDAQRFYLRHGFHEVKRTDGGHNEEGAPDILYAWGPA